MFFLSSKFFNNFFFYISSILISLCVAIPLITIFFGFFETTSEYFSILQKTFLANYVFNSIIILLGVLLFTFLFGFISSYLVSFYKFPGSSFFNWALILSFAVPSYIYAYSLTAFFENYGTLYSLLSYFFGEKNYNQLIPKLDGLTGAIISLSFSLYGYVFILCRASFYYQSKKNS